MLMELTSFNIFPHSPLPQNFAYSLNPLLWVNISLLSVCINLILLFVFIHFLNIIFNDEFLVGKLPSQRDFSSQSSQFLSSFPCSGLIGPT